MKTPKIVVTSPSFSNNEELVANLRDRFPNLALNEAGRRLSTAALRQQLADAEGAIVGLDPIDDEILQGCRNLQIISKYGVGLDNVDLGACERRKIVVGWTGGTNKRSVAELTLAFMLGLNRNVFYTSRMLTRGIWKKRGGRLLSGRRVGIIGLGNVGREVARLLRPMSCHILANDIVDVGDWAAQNDVDIASKADIYENCDVVTLHVPLTNDTYRMINRETLQQFKRDAYLINTSRGCIVDTAALVRALESKTIAGAAMDVFENEPPTDKKLLNLTNLVMTPHIGGNAHEAVMAMGMSAIDHLANYFQEYQR